MAYHNDRWPEGEIV